ncbi:MAG TPA: CBS domain-containing protein [Candidatus Thermoplasmatota archaeon]|nr:CBS domain-containing protein [Candidatus Thermoplasmatota archaeon]
MPDISSYIRTDCKPVDKRDGLHNVMGWVTGDSDSVPVVMDGGVPFGIVNERALMGRRIDPNARIETYTLTTRALSPTTPLEEAMARMAEFRAAHLPVANARGKLEGYVSAVDLVRSNGVNRRAADLCVPVQALAEAQTIGDALHAFNQEYVDYLPVRDAQGRVSGVLARRTILQYEASAGHGRGRKDAGGEKPQTLHGELGGFADATIVSVRPDAPAAEVVDLVEEHGYCFVIGNDGRLQGVATPQTLVRKAA